MVGSSGRRGWRSAEAVEAPYCSRLVAPPWCGALLAANEVLDMPNILRYGRPYVELGFVDRFCQVNGVREAPKKAEGVTEAVLLVRELLAFAGSEGA